MCTCMHIWTGSSESADREAVDCHVQTRPHTSAVPVASDLRGAQQHMHHHTVILYWCCSI